MSDVDSLGSLIRHWRLAAGLSQDALAQRAHLSADAIAALERGRRGAPRPETLDLLARALALAPAQRERLAAAASRTTPSTHGKSGSDRGSSATTSRTTTLESSAQPSNIPTNLPHPLSSFIGRENDLAQLTAALGTSGSRSRLVTLVGPGGIGKSRLALRVAATLLGRPLTNQPNETTEVFSDGVWLVDFSSIDDPTLVPGMAAATLGVREQPGDTAEATLIKVIDGARLLVVLDNCEHVVAACTALADRLLGDCPNLRVLATSREALGIPGELLWPVQPLSTSIAGSDAARSEAVRLFVDRASTIQPAFSLVAENIGIVTEICRHLDGIPLAIELAAARINALDLQTIADRLSDRFRFLSGRHRSGLPRHQTLGALVEWSYDLLSPVEQRLFVGLAVFAGGWSAEAVEAIAGPEQPDDEPILVLLAGLVGKSLVIYDEQWRGRPRYRLLETLRAYAGQRLDREGNRDDWRERHARHYLGWLEDLDPRVEGPEQRVVLDQVEVEIDNLRAALDWCVDRDDAAPGFRVSWSLAILAWLRGYLNEVDARLRTLLALPSAAAAALEARARALVSAGYVAFWRGELVRAQQLVEEGLAIYRRLDRPLETGQALTWLGLVFSGQDQQEQARSFFLEALEIFRELGDDFWTARAATNLGRCLDFLRDHARAAEYLRQALDLRRRLGDARGVANTLHHLADGREAAGEHQEAQALAEEALNLARSIGDRFVTIRALIGLGRVNYARGDLTLARRYLDEALTNAQRDGFGHEIAEVAVLLGLIARDEGDLPVARSWAEDGLSRARAGRQRLETARAWYLLGDLATREGQTDAARESLHQSLVVYRQAANRFGIALALARLAGVLPSSARTARVAGAIESFVAERPALDTSIEGRELARALGASSFQAAASADPIARAEGRSLTLDALAEDDLL